jgi:hypothetical protein
VFFPLLVVVSHHSLPLPPLSSPCNPTGTWARTWWGCAVYRQIHHKVNREDIKKLISAKYVQCAASCAAVHITLFDPQLVLEGVCAGYLSPIRQKCQRVLSRSTSNPPPRFNLFP